MRVLVCGGRDFQDFDFLIDRLNALHQKHGVTIIIEGGANGADAHAAIWADTTGIPRCQMPANWRKHGNGAGPIRNKAMLDLLKPDVVVAFDGGKGTSNMVELAKKTEGVKVWDLRRDEAK